MLQFVREIPVSIKIQKTLSHRRGFLFYVAAGFAGDVDPESGMIVNLVIVDKWLSSLKAKLEEQVFETDEENLNSLFVDIYSQALQFLKDQSQKQATLGSLRFREERGFGFSSHLVPVGSAKDIEFFSTQFMELVPPVGEAQLLKLQMSWQHAKACRADYAHENFKLLKPLTVMDAESLVTELGRIKNTKLASGSVLSRIEVFDPAQNVTLEI
jgi:hypothetical protein